VFDKKIFNILKKNNPSIANGYLFKYKTEIHYKTTEQDQEDSSDFSIIESSGFIAVFSRFMSDVMPTLYSASKDVIPGSDREKIKWVEFHILELKLTKEDIIIQT